MKGKQIQGKHFWILVKKLLAHYGHYGPNNPETLNDIRLSLINDLRIPLEEPLLEELRNNVKREIENGNY